LPAVKLPVSALAVILAVVVWELLTL